MTAMPPTRPGFEQAVYSSATSGLSGEAGFGLVATSPGWGFTDVPGGDHELRRLIGFGAKRRDPRGSGFWAFDFHPKHPWGSVIVVKRPAGDDANGRPGNYEARLLVDSSGTLTPSEAVAVAARVAEGTEVWQPTMSATRGLEPVNWQPGEEQFEPRMVEAFVLGGLFDALDQGKGLVVTASAEESVELLAGIVRSLPWRLAAGLSLSSYIDNPQAAQRSGIAILVPEVEPLRPPWFEAQPLIAADREASLLYPPQSDGSTGATLLADLATARFWSPNDSNASTIDELIAEVRESIYFNRPSAELSDAELVDQTAGLSDRPAQRQAELVRETADRIAEGRFGATNPWQRFDPRIRNLLLTALKEAWQGALSVLDPVMATNLLRPMIELGTPPQDLAREAASILSQPAAPITSATSPLETWVVAQAEAAPLTAWLGWGSAAWRHSALLARPALRQDLIKTTLRHPGQIEDWRAASDALRRLLAEGAADELLLTWLAPDRSSFSGTPDSSVAVDQASFHVSALLNALRHLDEDVALSVLSRALAGAQPAIPGPHGRPAPVDAPRVDERVNWHQTPRPGGAEQRHQPQKPDSPATEEKARRCALGALLGSMLTRKRNRRLQKEADAESDQAIDAKRQPIEEAAPGLDVSEAPDG
ncbi:MAG: hypothetical protein LBC97_01915 [Bifidobacteriaceae bacterium]|jgi:hypothetical protein|nr:hypothetical protein [Bifidobacteriaceae bacterium]